MSKVANTIPAHAIKELLLKAAVKTLGQRVYTKGRFFSACPILIGILQLPII
jgi:hypothetical protein